MQQIHPKGFENIGHTCRCCFSKRVPKSVVKTFPQRDHGRKKKFTFFCKVCKNKLEPLTCEITLDKEKPAKVLDEPELFEIDTKPKKSEEDHMKIREARKNRKKQKKSNSGLLIPESLLKKQPVAISSDKKGFEKVKSISQNPKFFQMLSKFQPLEQNEKLKSFFSKN